jgi:hypothetical protein
MALGEWLLQSSGLNQRQTDLETENLEAWRRREKRTGFIVSSQRNEPVGRTKLADKARNQ